MSINWLIKISILSTAVLYLVTIVIIKDVTIDFIEFNTYGFLWMLSIMMYMKVRYLSSVYNAFNAIIKRTIIRNKVLRDSYFKKRFDNTVSLVISNIISIYLHFSTQSDDLLFLIPFWFCVVSIINSKVLTSKIKMIQLWPDTTLFRYY